MERLNVATHPQVSDFSLGTVQLVPSRHSIERARDKDVFIPSYINIQRGMIVEMELENSNKVTKLVVRYPDEDSDTVLVIVPLSKTVWKVVTVWTNAFDDNHSTLNKERISI